MWGVFGPSTKGTVNYFHLIFYDSNACGFTVKLFALLILENLLFGLNLKNANECCCACKLVIFGELWISTVNMFIYLPGRVSFIR